MVEIKTNQIIFSVDNCSWFFHNPTNMPRTPSNVNQKTSIKLGNPLPGKQIFKSVNQLSYPNQKQISTSVDVLDPYKSHTTLTWIGGNDDQYTRHNITTDPFPGSKFWAGSCINSINILCFVWK